MNKRIFTKSGLIVLSMAMLFASATFTSYSHAQIVLPYERIPISSINDNKLDMLIESMAGIQIVAKDGTMYKPPSAPEVFIIPLVDFQDLHKTLYMFYMPDSGTYYFLQLGKDSNNSPEMRLWSLGSKELVISESQISIQQQGPTTFRIPSLTGGDQLSDISIVDAIACIAEQLGLTLDANSVGSLTNLIAGTVCSDTKIISLFLTANNCISAVTSVGGSLFFSTLGCVTGLTKLITCGFVNCNTPTSGGSITTLQNDVAVSGISGSSNSQKFYKITVPTGTTSLEIKISGGSGDCDLYVRRGQQPSLSSYDYRPYLGGNNETVTISNPQSGDWYIMLQGFTSYSGVTLKAKYVSQVTPPPSGVTTLQNNVAISGISGSLGSEKAYKITVPAGKSSLQIKISGGSGDCDLYVRRGQQPSLSSYDYRPYLGGNYETVTVSSPQSGDWYIMLHGYVAYSGVTLKAAY